MRKLLNLFLRIRPLAPGWTHPYDVRLLRQRLAALTVDDPVYPLLLGFLDAQIVSQASAQLSGDATEQFAGRLKMCADLKADLAELWQQAHPPKPPA